MDKRALLLILLIATPVFPRRSSGGGGMSAGRGSSGARGNPSGGFAGNQGGGGGFQGGHPGGGFQPNNNFRPQPQPGFGGGGFQQPHPNVMPPQRPNNIGVGTGAGAGRPNPTPEPPTSPITKPRYNIGLESYFKPTTKANIGFESFNPTTKANIGFESFNPTTKANIGFESFKPTTKATSNIIYVPVKPITQRPIAGNVYVLVPLPTQRPSKPVTRRTTRTVRPHVMHKVTVAAPAGGFSGAGGFRPGGGPSSFQQQGIGSRASSGGWKTALAAGALGAVGGVVAWEAGKAIIGNAHTPFSHGGRDYYWDNNGQAQMKNGMQMCSMPLETLQAISAPPATTTTTTVAPSVTVDPNAPSTTAAPTPDAVLNTIQYSNGTRPKTVSWSCNARTEVCCGTECCPAPVQQSPPINQSSRPSSTGAGSIGTIVALILIFLLLLCCCGCFIVYKCFGGICGFVSGDNKRDQYDQGQGEYPMQQYGQQQQYSQPQYDQHAQGGYPPQNQQYPAQGGYPPQPQYPNQYNPNQYPAYPQHPQY